MRHTGRIKFFDRAKGYGFIEADNMGHPGDIFLHASDIPAFVDVPDMDRHLEPGQPVSFEVQDLRVAGKRWRARRVQTIGGRYAE